MVAPACALWVGLLMGDRVASPWVLACAVLLALLLAALTTRALHRVGTLSLTLAFLAAAIARGAVHDPAPWRCPDPPFAGGRPGEVRAIVMGHPWRTSDDRVALLRIVTAERSCLSGATVRVRLPPECDVEWGDEVRALVQLDRPSHRRSPGGYDARSALRAQGVSAVGRAVVIRRLPSTLATGERVTWVRWRRAIDEALARGLSPAAREVVVPLVVGDRGTLGVELSADLQAAGLTHLIALSGLHVTWMAAVARGAAALLGGGPVARALAGALCAALYLGIAGPLPSLARAAATEWVATTARLRDRPVDPVQALAVSVASLLLISPGWADDLGFQLSCAATLGLTTIGAGMNARLAAAQRGWIRPLRLLVPTLAAQLAAQPLVLARFHALPWPALGANLLAVPVCELALAAAWLGAALDLAWPGSGALLFAACEASCAALRAVAGMAAGAPLALLPTGHHAGAAWVAAAGAALIAIALVPRPRRETIVGLDDARRHTLLLGVLLGLISAVFAATLPSLRPPPGRWWLVALDVGQGDALALGFRDGWWLIDAGPRSARFDAGSGVVLPFLRWAAVRRLEAAVVTHNHGDHSGGMARVLNDMRAGAVVVRGGWRLPAGLTRRPVRFMARGDTLRRDPPILVRWPSADVARSDENAGSLVLEVGEGRGRALLAADIDSLVETALEIAPEVAVLKVAHHGAGRSSGALALSRWRPRWAVVSCGRRNPFGHPDPGALERLRRSGARILRTDQDGAVWLELGADGTRVIDWRRAMPYAIPRTVRATSGRGPLAAAPAHW